MKIPALSEKGHPAPDKGFPGWPRGSVPCSLAAYAENGSSFSLKGLELPLTEPELTFLLSELLPWYQRGVRTKPSQAFTPRLQQGVKGSPASASGTGIPLLGLGGKTRREREEKGFWNLSDLADGLCPNTAPFV